MNPSIHFHNEAAAAARVGRLHNQRSFNQTRQPRSETIPPPYAWATERRAAMHNLHHLLANGIRSITGNVKCKCCGGIFEVEYDLLNKLSEVASIVARSRDGEMGRRAAAAAWMNPTLPDCELCGRGNCAKPVSSEKKRSVNWLFLFLGQMIGCCTHSELKYFCKHTNNYRTGTKERVLCLTYSEILRQLESEGSFDPRNI